MPAILDYSNALANLFRENLRVAADEKVLIVTDSEPLYSSEHPFSSRRDIAQLAMDSLIEQGIDAQVLVYDAIGSHGSEPPKMLWQK